MAQPQPPPSPRRSEAGSETDALARLLEQMDDCALSRSTGFSLRPAEGATLSDVADRIFGVQRRALVWAPTTGSAWHQHWTVHVVALRGHAATVAANPIARSTSAPQPGAAP